MVLNRDATSGGGAPNREVQLALPPIERSGFPGIPSPVCHSDIRGECGILVLGEDVWEDGLDVTSNVINLYLLVGERERLLLFEMASRPICCRAFERVGPLVHALGHYVRHTHRHSKWGTGLSCICSRHCVWGLEVALCELTYYHRWLNIGAALGNNQVSTGQSTLKIPGGYYNACELDDVLQPLGTDLRLHTPTAAGAVGRETSGRKSQASRPPWVFSEHIRARQHNRRQATPACSPQGGLRAPR